METYVRRLERIGIAAHEAYRIVFDFLKNNITNIVTNVISQVFSIVVGIILSIYFLSYKEVINAKLKKLICAIFKKQTYSRIVDFAR